MGNITLATECFKRSEDHASLLLIYVSLGLREELKQLCESCAHKMNLAFAGYFALGEKEACVELLVKGGRMAEAVLFARTYIPSEVSRLVGLWKTQLSKEGRVVTAEKIADPFDA